ERLQRRHEPPVPADDALDESAMPEMVEASLLAVALPGRIDERQGPRAAAAGRVVPRVLEEVLLDRDGNVLGEADADEAAGRKRIAAGDQHDRVACADELAILARAERRDHFLLGPGRSPGHARIRRTLAHGQ